MTTLADAITALTTLGHNISGNGHRIEETMRDCVRYVVRPEVDAIAVEILQSVPRSEIPWPLPILQNTWIEYSLRYKGHMLRYGMMLHTDGHGLMVFLQDDARWKAAPLAHDLAQQQIHIVVDPEDADVRAHLGWFCDKFLLILHMIQQPRVLERRPVIHDERLQRKRAKTNKPPLVDFHEVTVHITRHEQAAAAAAAEHEHRTGVRLHHVRAHYRVCRGVVQRIAGYWRGSAELGVVVASGHRVAR